MQRLITGLFVANAVLTVACTKDDGKAAEPGASAVELEGTAKGEPRELVARIGIEAGPVQRSEGAGAVLAATRGEVEVRRLGEETFRAAARDEALYTGDQVRAGDGAMATLVFPDESTVELAEVSTLAIGSRVATADPASSAALLSGVARFSVSPRAPGEGPFIVFTPAGVVATKGTVFGVGVAADGDARVGVESGAVEVAGSAALDTPVTVEADGALELDARGELDAPAPWPEDDWGAWRAGVEAKLDVAATAQAHADAMAALTTELEASYGELEGLGTQVASFEAEASADAAAQNTAGYEARLPDAALAIDASFLAGLHLEWLTHAYVSHAVLATDLYVRHPEVVVWAKAEPEVQAAVLWPKRLEATAVAYFEPLRVQYYVHHARGRAQAQFVGIAVPAFYAGVVPPVVPVVKARGKLKLKVFAPPSVIVIASARPLFIAAPSVGWQGKVKVKAAAPRGKLAFWVRPPQLEGCALLGVRVKGKLSPAFAARPPQARGQLKAKGGLALGHKIKVSPPDMQAAARARAGWKGQLHAPDARAQLEVPEVKAKGKGQAKTKASADADAELRAKGELKLKAPKVKAKGPKVKAEAKGSAKFGFGP